MSKTSGDEANVVGGKRESKPRRLRVEVKVLEVNRGGAKVEEDVCEEVLGLEELEGACEVETMRWEVEEEPDPEALREQ